jgi:hypothetical protein
MYSPFFQNVLLHSYCISAYTVCKCLHLSLYRMQMNEKVFVQAVMNMNVLWHRVKKDGVHLDNCTIMMGA